MATTPNNQFMDFTKIAGQFKMPNFDAESLIETQRKNIEAVTAANRVAFEGVQALTQRQVEILRQVWENSASAVQELTTAGKPEDKLAKQADLAKQAFEQNLANLRELTEMGAKSNTEATEVITARIAEGLEEVKTEIAKLMAAKK